MAQPDFNQAAQALQTLANQFALMPNMPTIQGQQNMLNRIQTLDNQAQARHNQLINLMDGLRRQQQQQTAQLTALTAQLTA